MNKEKLNKDQKTAERILKQGGIVIFPTDTAFGIGCRIDKSRAVDKLFMIRQRPHTQAMPLLVSSKKQALTYFKSPSDIVRRLMEKHWPGALTIVARCKKNIIYSPIRSGGDTIGLRMPDDFSLLKIIQAVGVPIIGTSANIHGQPTPYKHDDLDPKLMLQVDYVLPGKCKTGKISTVIDTTVAPPKILRQGAISINI